jgi:uncharacterized membrane protein YbaN (DUF454 family)
MTTILAMIYSPKRFAFLTLGWLCVALGAIGIVVPGLPTTPFMLVALWAFSKSSLRFRRWLYTHKRFGPPLRAWHRHGVIAPRAKAVALAVMASSLVIMLVFADLSWPVFAVAAAAISGAAIFVATRPGRPPDQRRPSR